MPVNITLPPDTPTPMTVRDVLCSEGLVWVVTTLEGPGLFFRVEGHGFSLMAAVGTTPDGGMSLGLIRNGVVCEQKIPSLAPGENVAFMVAWETTELSVGVGLLRPGSPDLDPHRVATPFTRPPLSLLKEVQQQGLLPKTTYPSMNEFHAEVVALFQSVDAKIASMGHVDAFWNVQRGERNTIVGRVPKHEVEIQPTIMALVQDQAMVRSIDIVREPDAAGGNVDFYAVAAVEGLGVRSVCIECKLAHSADLEKGWTTQLPAYMRARQSEFGLYVVLWFKGEDFDQPQRTKAELELGLQMDLDVPNDVKMRFVVLDLSRKRPPSAG